MSTFNGGSVGGGAQPGNPLLYYNVANRVNTTVDQSAAPVQISALKFSYAFNKSGGLFVTGDEAETTAANRRTRFVVQGNVQNFNQTTDVLAPFAVMLDTDRYLLTSNAQGSLKVASESVFSAVQASRSIGTPATNEVTYTAVRGGTPGNNITITQAFNAGVTVGTATVSPSITDAATDTVTILVEYNTTPANIVAAAVNADAVASRFVTATNSGTGNVVAGAGATMTGGQMDAVISGNLTINGQTTTVSTTQLLVTDPIILLNKDAVAATTSGGTAFYRGGGGNYDAIWFWNETADRFEVGFGDTQAGTVNPSTLSSSYPFKSLTHILPDSGSTPATIAFHGQVFSNVVSTINELWYVDNNGTATQLTSNGAVNVGAATGTTNLTWSVNSDAIAATAEDAEVYISSGSGNDLYRGSVKQIGTGTYENNLALFTRINGGVTNTKVLVGEPTASGASRTANLSLVGTTAGAAIRTAEFTYSPGSTEGPTVLVLGGNATTLRVPSGFTFTSLGSSANHDITGTAPVAAVSGLPGDNVRLISATGGEATGGVGGFGGNVSMLAGSGGIGTTVGGSGGDVAITAGVGGTGPTGGAGGNVSINAGLNPVSSAEGILSLGTTSAATINLGKAGTNVIVSSSVASFQAPHLKLPEGSDPSTVANTGFVYSKDVSSVTELFYRDSAGSVVQITSGGAVNAGGTSTGTTSLTYEINTDATGTESAALILSSASGGASRQSRLTQFSTGTTGLSRTNAGTATNVNLLLNVPGTAVASLTSQLTFFGTTAGSADRQADLLWPVTGTNLVLGTDLLGFTGNTTGAFTLATQSNNHLILDPNGTGQVRVTSTTLNGTNASGLTITTSTGDLTLASVANSDVNLSPGGTGVISATKSLLFNADATHTIGLLSTFRPLGVYISDELILDTDVFALTKLAGDALINTSGSLIATAAVNESITLAASGTGSVVVSAPLLSPGADATTALGTASLQYTNLFLSGAVRHTESSDPTAVANTGFVYTKDFAGNTELAYRDSTGNVVQITSGGSVNAGGSTPSALVVSSLTNASGGTLTQGTVTYINGDGTFSSAQADAAATSTFFGIVSAASIADTAAGAVTTAGTVTIPTGKQTGTWVAGDIIYIDPATAGKLTNASPSAAGEYVVEVGLALNTPGGGNATLLIRQQNKVLLS